MVRSISPAEVSQECFLFARDILIRRFRWDINFWVLDKPLAAFLSDQERQSIDWSLTFSDVSRDYCWDIPKLLSLVLHPDIVEVIRAIPLPEGDKKITLSGALILRVGTLLNLQLIYLIRMRILALVLLCLRRFGSFVFLQGLKFCLSSSQGYVLLYCCVGRFGSTK